MRRAIVLLGLTTLVLAGWSGGAKTSPVVASASAQRQAAAAYWTAERMKNAKPVPLLVKHGTPPNGGRIAQSTHYPFPYARYRWSGPTTDLPARTWGKVFFAAPDGDYVCSGTAVSSKNGSVVWTAGHCAATAGAKSFYKDRWIFVPAYDNGKAPFGKFVAQTFFTTHAWYAKGDSAFDLAAVVVAPLKGKTLVDTVGGQGIAFNQTRTQEYVSGGYPADYPFDGQTLYVCDAPLGGNDRSASPPDDRHWLRHDRRLERRRLARQRPERPRDDRLGEQLGYFSQPDAMYGPYQGHAAERLYDQASNWK